MSPVVRANWWLATLALLLAGMAWWCQQNNPAREFEPVTSVATDKVRDIRLLREGQPIARLQRHGKIWTWHASGKPVQDRKWVDTLLHMARLPSLHRFPADPSRLEEFALKPPRYTLILDDQILEFGKLDPASGLRYLRVGKNIHLVTDSYTHLLSRSKP